jgi:serine phosphatase RsbU (regulator of sigma subunit)
MANDNVGEAILYGQTLLAELHNLVLTRSHDKRIALKAAILLQEANYQINEVINVNSANLEIEVTDRLNVINHLSLEFLNNFNIDELLPMLIKHLPYLKISGCYIALFTNQQTNYDKLRKEACDELRKEACDELRKEACDELRKEACDELRKETCDTVHLILAYKDNQALPLEQLDSIYPAKKILPDKYLNPDKTNSFVILPLCFQSHKLGIIVFEMENSINKYWLILTKQLCNVIEGSFLVKEKETLLKEINEKNTAINETLNSLWGEMELAKKIQVSILPKTQQLEGFQVSPYLRPSEEVSGNYYDIIALPDSTYWLIIADVTEHGILTGLITMMLQTSISNTINIRADITARELLCAVNKTVFNTLKKRLLLNHSIKACFIRFNPEGNLEIAGTGQDILIYRKMSRRVEKITAKGKWLSITENIEKDTDSLSGHMDPADVLCVYSDELTDLKNTHQESFGINNIIRILEENGHKEADEITEALTAGLRQFKGYQNDDITFIILKKI